VFPWRPDGPEPGFEAVLGAVRLIGDHHDVVAVGEHRVAVLVLAGHELLDGGEDDAARGTVAEFGAQVLPAVGLHRFLAQQVLRQREDAEQLPVEVVAVGDDDDRRVLHQRVLHDARGKAGHGDALAAALRMPDDAALVRSAGARGGDHLIDRRAHRMELVIAGDLLDQGAVVLEEDEVAQVVEQHGRREQAAYQRFQFVEFAERVERQLRRWCATA
jgi:hypothetical protein